MSNELVMGRFRLEGRLGSGGMGTVHRAFDERLERPVAVKEIHGAPAARVLREAQAAARLNHPAIVTLYELGERDGQALLVSELVEGRTLDRAARDGELSDRDVAEIGGDVCDALEHAHGRGVVHRDIKPQNVMVRPWGSSGRRAKLMDFGIASVAGSPGLTATGEVVGTLAYMAPEQADGLGAGPEADVYSLALSLYEAWAGRNPVAGATPAQTARRIGEPVPSLGEERPDLPARLVAAVDACLDPDPERRPRIGALRGALKGALPELDDECAVPRPGEDAPALGPRTWARLAGWVGAGVGIAALAGPAGLPGLALVLAALLVPGLAVARNPLFALLPALAPLLAAAGAVAALPALVAVAATRAAERAVLGACAFAAYVAGALALGAGARLGLGPPAAEGWEGDAAVAAGEVLRPIATPEALAGVTLFALAAPVLGLVLRAHPALALVGAMVWAAGLVSGLALVGNGKLAESPSVAVLGAGLAVAWVAWQRAREVPADGPAATAPAPHEPSRPAALHP